MPRPSFGSNNKSSPDIYCILFMYFCFPNNRYSLLYFCIHCTKFQPCWMTGYFASKEMEILSRQSRSLDRLPGNKRSQVHSMGCCWRLVGWCKYIPGMQMFWRIHTSLVFRSCYLCLQNTCFHLSFLWNILNVFFVLSRHNVKKITFDNWTYNCLWTNYV